MRDGVYGGYLRVYVPGQARLSAVSLDGQSVGTEQMTSEFGRAVFGRFYRVPGGRQTTVQFEYVTPNVVVRDGATLVYTLELRKQAGTDAMPVDLNIELPQGAELMAATVDGKPVSGTTIETDLKEDRQVEVRFKLPS
jgi:hypothetical protein